MKILYIVMLVTISVISSFMFLLSTLLNDKEGFLDKFEEISYIVQSQHI